MWYTTITLGRYYYGTKTKGNTHMYREPTGRVIKVVVEKNEQEIMLAAAKHVNLPLATFVRQSAWQRALKIAQQIAPKNNEAVR